MDDLAGGEQAGSQRFGLVALLSVSCDDVSKPPPGCREVQ